MRHTLALGIGCVIALLCTGCSPLDGQDGSWQVPSISEAPQSLNTAFEALSFEHVLPPAPTPLDNPRWRGWTSSRALVALADKLYVADEDNRQIIVLDRLTGQTSRQIVLEGSPHHLVVAPNGTIYASIPDLGTIVRILPGRSLVDIARGVGRSPRGMALTQEGDALIVAVEDSNTVVALDVRTMRKISQIDVYSPNAVAAGTEHIFIGNRHGFAFATWQDKQFEGIRDTRRLRGDTPLDALHFPSRVRAVVHGQAMAVSEDHAQTNNILFAHQQMLTGNMDSSINTVIRSARFEGEVESANGYGSNDLVTDVPELLRTEQPVISRAWGSPTKGAPPVLDPVTREPMTALLSQPSDIHHHPTWSLAFMTGFGSDNVLVFNTAVEDPMAAPIAVLDVGKAPRAITFSKNGRLAYVLNSHDFTISEIDLSPLFSMPRVDMIDAQWRDGRLMGALNDNAHPVWPIHITHDRMVAFAVDPLDPTARIGRRVFTFARHQGLSNSQLACATCHPNGEQDGLVWFNEAGPRQTPSLAGRLVDTAPYNWGGTEQTLIGNMNKTIRRMGGSGLNVDDQAALAHFLLEGLETPSVNTKLTEPQQRGKALFEDPVVGCSGCHFTDGRTDGGNHDVGTMSTTETLIQAVRFELTGVEDFEPIRYNTPTLRNLADTAPYFHDGSAQNLHQVLESTARTMGRTIHLTPTQKHDLIAYLNTL